MDDELLNALRLLDVPLHRLGSSSDQLGGRSVIVLIDPTPGELREAAAMLGAGGWVYAEVRRQFRFFPSRPRTLIGWQRAFRRLGLREVTAHWHAPNFANCSRIIAVNAKLAVRDALTRHQTIRFGRLLSVAGRIALRLGLFPLAVGEGSVVGRRPPSAPL